MIKSLLKFSVLLLTVNSDAQIRTFENEYYQFVIRDSAYVLSGKIDMENDFNYIPRRSKCNILSKGYIYHDTSNFYYLSSETLESNSKYILKKEFNNELNTDSIHITFNIPNFYKIDYENFYFIGNVEKRYKLIEKKDGVILNYKIWNASTSISLVLIPNNSKYLLTDYPYSLLEFKLININIIGKKENEYVFEIENFNPCDLYSMFFHKEYIKIIGGKLYWRDEILNEH